MRSHTVQHYYRSKSCTDWHVQRITAAQATLGKITPPPLVENLPLDVVTLAEHLEQHAGYVSAAIGKWHLGYDEIHQPKNQGFAATHEDPFPLSSQYTYSNDFLKFEKKNPGKKVGHFTAQAIRFMEQHRDQPFFLYWDSFR